MQAELVDDEEIEMLKRQDKAVDIVQKAMARNMKKKIETSEKGLAYDKKRTCFCWDFE